MAQITTKPRWAGYTRTIEVEVTNGTVVNYGENPTGDVVIESITLDPDLREFHPAWLCTTTQQTAAALREEIDVGTIQSFDDAIHPSKHRHDVVATAMSSDTHVSSRTSDDQRTDTPYSE
jgi:hypothetical protein